MRRQEKEPTRGVFSAAIAAGLLFHGILCAAPNIKPMAVLKSRIEVRMGEAVEIPAEAGALDFLVNARTRHVTVGGQQPTGLTMAPNAAGDRMLLASTSKSAPGEYALTLSAESASGEERQTNIDLVVYPPVTVPKSATRPPVVLINGWEAGFNASNNCPVAPNSIADFGNLAQYLVSDGVPVVYLFDNCAEDPNQSIETLAGDLNVFLNNIKYDDGTQVPQIDLIAHGMGGLIARAYLEGLQTNQTYLPPYNPLVRKLVLIATPNFGSFTVGNAPALFIAGSQGAEQIPGSATLWNLATWNQRGDDLAGVDAIAIVGNAGSYATLASSTAILNASDGLVSTTSASLSFVSQDASRTRIVPYCHVNPAAFTNTNLTYSCTANGIAFVTDPTHQTSVIVRSFLSGTTAWQSVGTTPTTDPVLATNGGWFFALQNSTAAYANDLTAVTWGTVALTGGGNFDTIYYTDYVTGTGMFSATSTSIGTVNCGTLSVGPGYTAAARCKINLAVTSVGPLTKTASGWAVTSGTALTVNGASFGSQCSNCKVSATPAGSTTPQTLSVTSWANTAIVVQLPASLTGYQTVQVNAVGGVDSIGVRAVAPVAQPVIAATPSALSFAYTTGGALPSSQPLAIANSGANTLTWTATVSDSWLSIDTTSGTAPSTINVSVAPALLAAGTYNGTVTIAGTNASNTPLTVAVTLVVTGAPAFLVVAPQSLSFSYTAPGAPPAAQTLSISNGGGGSFTWVAASASYWATVSPANGALPATLTVSVLPGNLAPGQYNTTITIGAADNSVTPVTVAVSLTVQGTGPTPSITGAANAASYQPNFASATWVAIFGTNLSQLTYAWQARDFVNGALPTALAGVTVTINGLPAYVSYVSPTQINALAPDDPTTATGTVQVQVTTAGQGSNSYTLQKQQYSPGFLTFDGTHVAALHLDYSLVQSATPAKPGETIALYAVGFGPTNPPQPTGQTPTVSEPLATMPQVSIGGMPATVSFAGISGPGLYQFNVIVPNVPNGDAALTASIGGVSTQSGVAVPVQQ